MGRSRAAAIAGARRVIAERGVRKATMGDVAVRGGLAKATLYNHVRTKDELLVLVVDDAGDRVLAAAAGALGRGDLVTAFAVAAAELAGDELLVGLRRVEPTALLAVAAPGSGPGWDAARARVAAALHRAGRQVEDGSSTWCCAGCSPSSSPRARPRPGPPPPGCSPVPCPPRECCRVPQPVRPSPPLPVRGRTPRDPFPLRCRRR